MKMIEPGSIRSAKPNWLSGRIRPDRLKKERRKMKKSCGVMHVMANCVDCGKVFDNFKNGQACAAKHAKTKKHKVSGEVTIGFVYDGRK